MKAIVLIYPNGSAKLFGSITEAAAEIGTTGAHVAEIADGKIYCGKRRRTINGYKFRWPTEDELREGKIIMSDKPFGYKKSEPIPDFREVKRLVIWHCKFCNRAFEFNYDSMLAKTQTGIIKAVCPVCNSPENICLIPPIGTRLDLYLNFRYE